MQHGQAPAGPGNTATYSSRRVWFFVPHLGKAVLCAAWKPALEKKKTSYEKKKKKEFSQNYS